MIIIIISYYLNIHIIIRLRNSFIFLFFGLHFHLFANFPFHEWSEWWEAISRFLATEVGKDEECYLIPRGRGVNSCSTLCTLGLCALLLQLYILFTISSFFLRKYHSGILWYNLNLTRAIAINVVRESSRFIWTAKSSFSIAGKKEYAIILLRADRAHRDELRRNEQRNKTARKERTLRQYTRCRNRRYDPFRNIAKAVRSQVRLE